MPTKKKVLSDFLIVVPARLGSTRLKEKMILDLAGKPLVVRVYDNLLPLKKMGAEVVVATDDDKVINVCKAHNVSACLTRSDHQSGTDRVYEVAKKSSKSFIINVQGDEPFILAKDLVQLAKVLKKDKKADIATLGWYSEDAADFQNPNIVKIILTEKGDALYFTRAPSPYHRDSANSGNISFWQHMGVYAFRKPVLKKFCSLKQSNLEKIERLEQLRALENGFRIIVTKASNKTIGIDTIEDLEAARARFNK